MLLADRRYISQRLRGTVSNGEARQGKRYSTYGRVPLPHDKANFLFKSMRLIKASHLILAILLNYA